MKNPFRGARYANVTATLALVVALGGTGYAAATIGTKDIKNNAVTSAKIKNKGVLTKDLKDGGVSSLKIKDDGVRPRDVADIQMHDLTLLNGWSAYPGLTAQVGIDAEGVVHLRGGVTQNGGFNGVIATLPEGFRPSETVYVATNLLAAAGPARLNITTGGTLMVQVGAPATDAQAQGFTSITTSFVP